MIVFLMIIIAHGIPDNLICIIVMMYYYITKLNFEKRIAPEMLYILFEVLDLLD